MTFLFDPEVECGFDFDHIKLYERAAGAALSIEECPFEVCVALLLTDDEGIRQINKESRNIDAATDVLSFPMLEFSRPADFENAVKSPSDIDPETGEVILGDIVLSKDRIISQADSFGHDIQREFAFLIVHSMLHLFGYDHMNDDDRMLMEEHQRLIMESLYDDFPMLVVKEDER